ncbi:hypothetical protein [Teredinibacter sp. KSP-S5-2]|uniref:hypothetical protein n=1 Tax=Teredinibacter sp. KSP-S5-2 TaxID=3034506 RepID=UPI002934C33E|nr:hypothetical protein [Teredinibacter sp. KSP-S5-2]WNO11656.1 hypothetical protein P5V12_10780 [Teredinibacter sp. KSP-S5-2]
MGVEYVLVNQSKKEVISFSHLNGSKKRELAGNPPQSAIVTWYLLENQGDLIQFVSDTFGEWPFLKGSSKDVQTYKDVTNKYISNLVEEGILKNEGFLYQDEENPETDYVLNLKNIWVE